MSDNNYDDQLQELIDKLDVDIDWARAITPEEVEYLLLHCPFLQILDTDPKPPHDQVNIITAESSNWKIQDHGDAMSSSPGKFIFGGGYFQIHDDDEDEGGSGIVNPGQGTIVNQAFNTAKEMAQLAKQNNWAGIHIVDGHPVMIRGAIFTAMQLGLGFSGYELTERDYTVRERLRWNADEMDALRNKLRLGQNK